jgi:hypothetical protein
MSKSDLFALLTSYLEIIEDGNMTFWRKQHFNLAGRGVEVSNFMSICQMTQYDISIITEWTYSPKELSRL